MILQWDMDQKGDPLPARKIYEHLLPEVVGRLTDPEVPYHRGSPYGGKGWDTADPTIGDVVSYPSPIRSFSAFLSINTTDDPPGGQPLTDFPAPMGRLGWEGEVLPGLGHPGRSLCLVSWIPLMLDRAYA